MKRIQSGGPLEKGTISGAESQARRYRRRQDDRGRDAKDATRFGLLRHHLARTLLPKTRLTR